MSDQPFKTPTTPSLAIAGFPRTNIAAGLVAGIVALNILVALGLGGMAYRSMAQSEQAAREMILARSQAIEEAVARTLDTTEASLLMAGDQYRHYRDGRITKDALNFALQKAKASLRNPYGVRIADRAGTVLQGNAATVDSPVRIEAASYFTALRGDPKATLAISAPMWSKATNHWSVIVATRIAENGGTFGGIAYTAMPIESFTRTYSAFALTPKDIIELRDDKLTLLARFPASADPAEALGSTSAPSGLRQFATTSESLAVSRSDVLADGDMRLYAYRKSPGRPLIVVAGMATTTQIANSLETVGIALAAFLAIALVSAFVGRWIYRVWQQESVSLLSLAASEKAFRRVFENAPLGMEIVSLDGRLLQVNVALCDLLGYPMNELIGKSLADITDQEDFEKEQEGLDFLLSNMKASLKKEKQYIHRDGHTICTQRTVILARDQAGKPSFLIAQIEDITQRKEELNEIEGFARLDTLTGLPNRRTLMDRLLRGIKQAAWNHVSLVLMFIDLDGFKKINDSLGHDIGDEILKAAATRLSACVRSDDTVARQGGDEFVIILKEIGEPANAALVAQKVVTTMAAPMQIGQHTLGVTASIGIAICPPAGGVSMETLVKQADTAMYWTKQAGRNGYTFYDEQRDTREQDAPPASPTPVPAPAAVKPEPAASRSAASTAQESLL